MTVTVTLWQKMMVVQWLWSVILSLCVLTSTAQNEGSIVSQSSCYYDSDDYCLIAVVIS